MQRKNLNSLKENITQILYGFLAATTLAGCGMSMGYSAMVLPELTNANTIDSNVFLDETSATWFASIITIAIPLGCFFNLVTMKFGRRVDILSAGIMNILGWVLITTSYNVPQLLIGRCLTGLSTGMIATPGATYLAEMSTPFMGPVLTPAPSLFIAIGNLIIYLFAYSIQGWRNIAAAAILVQATSAITIFLMLPESPRWLLCKGRMEEAKRALLALRGLKQETQKFNEEFSSMVYYNKTYNNGQDELMVNQTKANNNLDDEITLNVFNRLMPFIVSIWNTLKMPQVWKPLVILNLFFLFQQFSGTYVFLAYSVDFMSRVDVKQDPYLISIFTGIIQIVICLLTMTFSTRIGRRKMAPISGIGMSLSLLTLGMYKQVLFTSYFDWLPISSILIYTASSSLGFMTLPWAMIGELYPTKFVNGLGVLTTCCCGLYNFIAVQMYPSLVSIDILLVIYLYCSVSIVATLFVIFALPETVGKTKIEIEKQFL